MNLGRKIFHQLLTVNLVANVSISKTILPERLASSTCIFAVPSLRDVHHVRAASLSGRVRGFITGTACFDPLADPHLFLRRLRSNSAFCNSSTRRASSFSAGTGRNSLDRSPACRDRDQHARRHIADKRTVVGDENNRPVKVFKNPSSQSMVSISRWFVVHQATARADYSPARVLMPL